MVIRAMDRTDWPRVAAIFQQGIDSRHATMHTTVPAYEVFDHSRDQRMRLVAEIDGNIVGWVAVTRVSERPCYNGVLELAIYVDVAARKHGVGTALLNELIEESERLGVWTLEAHIFEENAGSLALHKKCGFRYVGIRERIGADGFGQWHNTVLMERRSKRICV